MIRFFCVIGAGEAGDVPYRFLRALEDLEMPVRALPIGPSTAMAQERRWFELVHVFARPMAIPFVNVVCAPWGYRMGMRAAAKVLSGTSDLVKRDGQARDVQTFAPELRTQLQREMGPIKQHDDVEYVPDTAFAQNWTAGVKNVAIVPVLESGICRGEAAEAELAFVQQNYDLVIYASDEASLVHDVTRILDITSGAGIVNAPRPSGYVQQLLSDAAAARAYRAARLAERDRHPPAKLPKPRFVRLKWWWRSLVRRFAFWRRRSIVSGELPSGRSDTR